MNHFLSGKLADLWSILPVHLKADATKTTKRPTQADFNLAMNRHRADMDRAIDQYRDGKINDVELFDKLDQALFAGHSEAWALGRRRATGKGPGISEADRLMGIAAKDEEQEWLQAFQDDIRSGRYTREDGTIRDGAIRQRAGLYVGKMRGTANVSFVEAGPDQMEYVWVLVPELHCLDCPRIAARSPYTKDTLFTHPGNGDTECLGNCKCYLKRADGVEAFRRMDVEDEGETVPATTIDFVDGGTKPVTELPEDNPDLLPDIEQMTIDDYIEHGKRTWAKLLADNRGLREQDQEATDAMKKREAMRVEREKMFNVIKDKSIPEADRMEAARQFGATQKEWEAVWGAGDKAEEQMETAARDTVMKHLIALGKAENATDIWDFLTFGPKVGELDKREFTRMFVNGQAGQEVRRLWPALPRRYREVMEDQPIKMVPNRSGRAFMTMDGTELNMGPNRGAGTFFHEYAHGIECRNRKELALSLDELWDRIDPKAIELYNGVAEVTEADKFAHEYQGKIYNLFLDSSQTAPENLRLAQAMTRASKGHIGTEIMSMALEYFTSGERGLYWNDRRSFMLMLGRLADRR